MPWNDHEPRPKSTVAGKATAGVPPVPDAWYVWFVAQIREHGYQAEFAGRTYTYLNVGGWKYWSLPGSDGVTIINRARLATSSVDVIDVSPSASSTDDAESSIAWATRHVGRMPTINGAAEAR